MRTRARWWLAGALLALAAASGGATGCSGSSGQLMFAFQTDMSLPKDIDAIRLLVTREGKVVFDETYEKLGTEEGIRLPATLGFLTPEDPTQPLHLRVIGTQGGNDQIRVLREVVTTVPKDRTALLQVPIHFLCYGSAEAVRNDDGTVAPDENGGVKVKSTLCQEGDTCEAGSCVTAQKESETLPEYEPAALFGGGEGDGSGLCFDTVQCFAKGASVELEFDEAARRCWATVPGGATDINVALLTQGGGICGDRACYVPLDAGDGSTGWSASTAVTGSIDLPVAVCEKAMAGKLLGLTIAQAEDGFCQKKSSNLPTCGPWSASGAGQYTAPDKTEALPIALGLLRPVALTVTPDRDTPEGVKPGGVYWIEGGTFDGSTARNNGAVRWAPRHGGNPLVLEEELRAPSDLVADNATGVVFWTVTGVAAEDGMIRAFVPETGEVRTVLEARRKPLGIARHDQQLLWTEQLGDQVFQVTTTGRDSPAPDQVIALTEGALLGSSPYRIAAARDVVCWIYEGELGNQQTSPGAVACKRGDAPAEIIAEQQGTPQAIALDTDTAGDARAVYWANLEDGTISRADLSSIPAGAPQVLAEGQSAPRGIAVDDQFVYWTNWIDGTVLRAPKEGGTPRELATNQARPRTIVVDAEAIYWINEGSKDLTVDSVTGDGSVMRLLKAALAE